MKFLIANDLHLGSKHATHTLDEVIGIIYANSGIRTVFNGDIVDLANCKHNEVKKWKEELCYIARKVTQFGGVFIRGNHSLDHVDAPDFAIVDNVYFTHGDLGFIWPKEKAEKYREKDCGAGFFKRTASQFYDVFRKFKPFKPTQMFYKKCDEVIAEFNPRAIVLGHFHPKENIIFDYKGVKVYILKRGIQEIEI